MRPLTEGDLTPDAERMEALKAYMQVFHDEDDALIARLYGVAVAYLHEAGVVPTKDPVQLALYNQAVDGLTLSYYDQRKAETPGNLNGFDFGLRMLVNQLKLTAGAEDP